MEKTGGRSEVGNRQVGEEGVKSLALISNSFTHSCKRSINNRQWTG